MDQFIATAAQQCPWNKGRLIGQKLRLRLKEIWAIRIRLQLARRARELALFNLAIASKLRGCDLVSLRVCDIAQCSRWDLGSQRPAPARAVPLSEPAEGVDPSLDEPVRTHR